MNRISSAAPRGVASTVFAVTLGVSAVIAFLACPIPVNAQEPAPVTVAETAAPVAPKSNGAVRAQATWDSRYLYVLLSVDDPDVQGTNTLPISDPQKDDSVAIYLQTGGAKPDKPDAQTHAMLVSAAGGFTFLAGDADGNLNAKPVFSIKYGVAVGGTLNRSDDTDTGYTVELAIPWSEVGILAEDVKAGAPFSINVVVRDRGGRSFSANAPGVTAETDVTVPSKWIPLVLGESEGGNAPAGAVFAPPAPTKDKRTVPPTIDGAARVAGEWPGAGKFSFAAPSSATVVAPKVAPVTVAAPVDNTPPVLNLSAETLAGLEPLLFARYTLGIQGDGRKITPFAGTFDGRSGAPLLADQPLSGAGSWFSSDRASWHRGLLYEMRRTGVDAALVAVGTGTADLKALYVLVETLREMTQDGLPTPKIALELDTTGMGEKDAPLDVSTAAGQAKLYAAVSRFFFIVPPQYRARVTLPVVAGGVPVYPVFFSGTGLAGTEGAGWTNAVRDGFAAQFGAASGGAGLVFVGGAGFDAAKSPGLVAGNVPLLTGGVGTGTLPIAVVQPGIETAESLVSRKAGETYQKSWETALAAKSKWFVLDSWNDYRRGTEVAASRQYGSRYLDATRIFSVQTGNIEGLDLRWRTNNVPRRMRVGQAVPVIIGVQNGGGTALRPEEGYALAYRWKQDGKTIAEAPLRSRLNEAFLPTQNKSFLVGLTSLFVDGSGKLAPLPPGDYALEIDFVKLKDPAELLGAGAFLSDTGAVSPLVVPVSLYADNRQSAIFESTTTPALLQAGVTYPINVSVRYMGADDLPTGTAALTWQLATVEGNVVATGSSPVNELLPSGVPVSVPINVTLNDATGLPVSPSFPELPEGRGTPGGGYKLRWLLTRTDSTDAVPGDLIEQVAVYAGDEEIRFPLPETVPDTVVADSRFVLKIPLINRGTTTWKAGEYRIGAHWYFSDGLESRFQPAVSAPLPKNVAPGEEITVSVPVRAPETDGAYIVVPDVYLPPDNYLSTRPVSRIGDIVPIFLRVTGGRLTFVDLTKSLNVDAVAPESAPTDGDANGGGATFPAESFPPDEFGLSAPPEPPKIAPKDADGKVKPFKPGVAPAYPSGYYADFSPSARRIAFRYAPTENGAKNAVSCAGQVIAVSKANYIGIHLAATATGGQTEKVPIILTYADKTTQNITVSVRDWHDAPVPVGDTIAVMTRRTRTSTGDEAKPAYVRHVIAPVDVSKELVSVTFPTNDKVKVFAVTLDK
ncbi:MAG: hypothetical protein H7Y38_03790 [Armatimonadetes bacterium]|nr:hypothetical protein [Armatimonadota bacterium]